MLTLGLNNYALAMHTMTDVPLIFKHFIKTLVIHCHNTRLSSDNFVIPSVSGVATTIIYYSAFKGWNSLPPDVKIRSNYSSVKGAAKA